MLPSKMDNNKSNQNQGAVRLKEEGLEFFEVKNYTKALKKFVEATRCDNQYKEAFLNAGVCCMKIGRLSDALKHLHCAIELDPTYSKAILTLGKAFCKVNQLSDKAKTTAIYSGYHDLLKKTKHTCVAPVLYYLIADIKLNSSDEIKFLEFGDGMRSGTRTTANNLIEDLITVFNKPVFLCSYPGQQLSNNDDLTKTLSGWNKFKDGMLFDPAVLSTYRGIYGGHEKKPVKADILKLNSNTDVTIMFDEKPNMHELFVRSGSVSFRPVSKVFPMVYSTDMVNEIIRDIPGDVVVVKNSDGCGGKGVMLVPKKELDETLKILLTPYIRGDSQSAKTFMGNMVAFKSKHNKDLDIRTCMEWKQTDRHLFVVEELIRSNPVTYIDGKQYDPTMRVAFLLHNFQNTNVSELTVIDAYWKFPPEPISNGLVRDSIVSSFTVGNERRMSVDETLVSQVSVQLAYVMPKLLSAAITCDINSPLQCLSQIDTVASNNAIELQVDALQVLRAHTAAHDGHFEIAFYSIYEYLNRNEGDSLGKYETALLHYLTGDYITAIALFNEVANGNAGMYTCYCRLAACYRKQNDFVNANKNLNIAREHLGNTTQIQIEAQEIQIAQLTAANK